MTTCPRNLPQHFNGCTCTTAPGTVTGEVDIDLTPTARPFVPTPPIIGPGLTRPKTCWKCKGGGDFTYASGFCAPCSGTGEIESDKATIAARKARQEADSAFYAAHATNYKTQWSVSVLREHEPERYEKALGSFLNGHPGLADALEAHYAEHHPRLPDREIARDWGSFDDLPESSQEAIRHQTTAVSADEQEEFARTRQWQWARVPVSIMAERIMAADPELVENHGTFEAYHAWYMGRGNVVDHGDSYWPSIEAPESTGGYLDDGWHRFHSYVAKGAKNVPVLRWREPVTDSEEQAAQAVAGPDPLAQDRS